MFSGAFVTFLSDGVGSQGVGSGCGRDRILRCIGRTGYPVGPERLDFLYPNTSTGSSIELRPSVAFCFRKFHPLISDLVRGAWARYVRQQNLAVVGETTDLNEFLFGSERAALAAVRPVLLDIQQGRCFYCHGSLKADATHVDHFVAWACHSQLHHEQYEPEYHLSW